VEAPVAKALGLSPPLSLLGCTDVIE